MKPHTITMEELSAELLRLTPANRDPPKSEDGWFTVAIAAATWKCKRMVAYRRIINLVDTGKVEAWDENVNNQTCYYRSIRKGAKS